MSGFNLPPAPWSYDYAGTLKDKTEAELYELLAKLKRPRKHALVVYLLKNHAR